MKHPPQPIDMLIEQRGMLPKGRRGKRRTRGMRMDRASRRSMLIRSARFHLKAITALREAV